MVTALLGWAGLWLQLTLATQASWGYLPAPLIPPDNPLTAAKIVLGQRLFHETRLSVNSTYSCASCHLPERYFTDGRAQAIGALGERLALNTPTLYYSAFHSSLGWQKPGAASLEEQHLTPLLSVDPVEMGFSVALLTELTADPSYEKSFAAAFGETNPAPQWNTQHVVQALASYVRSLNPPPTAFDRYVFEDDTAALSSAAKAGMTLFFSARLGCSECHASLALSGPIQHSVQQAPPVFHIMHVSGSGEEFRAPTLRYVSHTAPYMHDGSMPTLAHVIDHYVAGPSPRVPRFSLSTAERTQLIAFLETL